MSITLWRENAARFFSKVETGTDADCWPWRGKISAHHGTGIFAFRIDGKVKPRAPHLVSWVLYNGEIAANKRIEARCKNLHCCNPKHLFVATKQGVVRRCATKTYDEMIESKFWGQVKKLGEYKCWIWQGPRSHFGHGCFYRQKNNKSISEGAHRFIFFRLHPDTDPHAHICHHCDVPECVNPKHLYAGSATTNAEDRAKRGRNAKAVDGRQHGSKLNAEKVREILRLSSAGALNQRLVAKQFGVSQSAISNVVHRLTWRHVNPEADHAHLAE